MQLQRSPWTAIVLKLLQDAQLMLLQGEQQTPLQGELLLALTTSLQGELQTVLPQ